jgi:hypothetical protein
MQLAHILSNRGQAGHDWQAVESALQAAVSRGDLIRYQGRRGEPRFAARTAAGLEAVIEAQAARDHPDRELIARCNQALQEVRADE